MNEQERRKEFQEKVIKDVTGVSILDYSEAMNLLKNDSDESRIFVMIDEACDVDKLLDFGYVGNINSEIDTGSTNYTSKEINTMVLHSGTIGNREDILEKAKPYIKCIFS